MKLAMEHVSGVYASLGHFSFRRFHSKLKQRNLRWKISCAVGCFLVALMLLGISLFSTLFLEFFIFGSIRDFVVVSSMGHERFEDWEDNTAYDAVPLYVDVYFWNLSNLEDIRSNSTAKPNFTHVGPFSYRKYYKKINVTFHDSGGKVSYDRWTYYVPQPDRSALPDSTLITSVSSGYLGVMNAVGSETNLLTALVPSECDFINKTLGRKFARGIVAGKNVTVLLDSLKTSITQAIMTSRGVSEQQATQTFYDEWATTPSTLSPEWERLGSLGQFPTNSPPITNRSSSLLWDVSLSSLVNASDVTLLKWDSPSDEDSQQLMGEFAISDEQLTQILQWRSDFREREVTPDLLARYGVPNIAGIGYLQWGEGSVTGGESVLTYVPALGFDAIPEIALFDSNSTVRFASAASKTLLGKFITPTGVPQFLGYYFRSKWQDINTTFGLDESEARVMKAYIDHLTRDFAEPTLDSVFAKGGGLFTTQTAFDWIWGFEDPLLKALRSPDPTVKVMDNVTTIEEAERNANVSLYYTGRDDLDKAARYIEWRGRAELAAGTSWPVAVPIRGTSGLQFKPFLKESDDVLFFSEDLMRPFELGYSRQVTTMGITLYRYHPIPEDFDPNPDFNQEIPGFANMTQTYGIPFFLSQPNFLNVPTNYSDLIVGMNPTKKDDTYVDIEPITGTSMDASKKLQVNMYLKNSTIPLDKYNADIPKGRFYPTMYIDETAKINDKLAEDFKATVYLIVSVRTGLFWSFFLAGILATLACCVCSGYVCIRYRRSWSQQKEYETVGVGEETPIVDGGHVY